MLVFRIWSGQAQFSFCGILRARPILRSEVILPMTLLVVALGRSTFAESATSPNATSGLMATLDQGNHL